MIKFWITIFFSTTILNVFGQKNKNIPISELINPPGGIYLYDSIFIDDTEMTNIGYLEYLHYIESDSSNSFFLSQLPDSTCWQIGLQSKDSINPYVYRYLRYPGFRFMPVIGVSYEQAINYCKWRGYFVTESFNNGYFIKKYPKLKEYDIVIEYRLPTKEEWEFAAYGGLDKEKYLYGLKRPIVQRLLLVTDTAFGLEYIYEFPPNNYGLYNMIGNVAEMTNSKGIAKGGSFRDKLSDFNIETDFKYDKPKEWLGFRCIAIVHLKKKQVKQ